MAAEVETTPPAHELLNAVPALRDRELELRLVRRSPAGSGGAWTPAYHFEMVISGG